MILNNTPVRTSKNFGINNLEIKELEIPSVISEFDNVTISGNLDGIEIFEKTDNKRLVYGISSVLEEQVYSSSNKNIKIEFDENKNIEQECQIKFGFNDENINLIENVEIIAKTNSKATVIIKYISEEDRDFFHNGIIKVRAEENSKINVIVVNMLNEKSNNFVSIENTVEKDAILNFTITDLGGKYSVSNYYTNLSGDNSESNLNTIYLGNENQVFDLNYIVHIRGENAKANIEVQGALKENSKKNFKGTLDFKKGCKKSKGYENEFCFLLSEKARSKALPMLLCTEEDIEGSHSTASGRPDDKILFYIMSRGFSYNEALKLIVKSKFDGILNNIKNEELKQDVINIIDLKLEK